MIIFRFLISVFFVFLLLESNAQDRAAAFEMNERIGRGINMGNSFEAPSENEWGNPWKPEYFEILADLGFSHVRLPVRWEPADRSAESAPYTIAPAFLKRIQEVVDAALKNKLHIIVNMHHHEALFENPDEQKDRFLSMWNQIATYFQDYPDSLLFEVLNEPHGNITPEKWNVFFAEALDEIRKTNPNRMVLMGIAEYGGLGGLPFLEVPDDEYIIVSPHYYNPFTFTHQGAEWVENSETWLGTEWNDTEADRETVAGEFSYAIQFSQENNVPVHVGEFGAYGKADMASREKWTTFLARWFEEQGFSWAYWEFSAGFGIYNPDTKTIVKPLVNALLYNEMPDPIPVITKTLYESDFSSSADGWILNTQGGAAGSTSYSAGKLVVSISSPGTEGWHAQLTKNNIALENGRMYRISFRGQTASENRSASVYAGKASDPWTSYSGYNSISLTPEEVGFAYSFTMSAPTDPVARLVFDLGKSSEGLKISDVKVELIKFVVTGVENEFARTKLKYYPNPVADELHIEQLRNYRQAELMNLNGQKLDIIAVSQTNGSINFSQYPKGMYILKLSGKGNEDILKIVKN